MLVTQHAFFIIRPPEDKKTQKFLDNLMNY